MNDTKIPTSQVKVYFLSAPSASEKISILLKIAKEHADSFKKILFVTADKVGTDYLDKLFWEHPKEGFLPHNAGVVTFPAFVTISHTPHYDDESNSFFNLTKEPLNLPRDYGKIYELDESHHLEKKKIFEKKYKYYSERNYHLISL